MLAIILLFFLIQPAEAATCKRGYILRVSLGTCVAKTSYRPYRAKQIKRVAKVKQQVIKIEQEEEIPLPRPKPEQKLCVKVLDCVLFNSRYGEWP